MLEFEIPLCIMKLTPENTRLMCQGFQVPFSSLLERPWQNLKTGQWRALANVGGALVVVECKVTRVK